MTRQNVKNYNVWLIMISYCHLNYLIIYLIVMFDWWPMLNGYSLLMVDNTG